MAPSFNRTSSTSPFPSSHHNPFTVIPYFLDHVSETNWNPQPILSAKANLDCCGRPRSDWENCYRDGRQQWHREGDSTGSLPCSPHCSGSLTKSLRRCSSQRAPRCTSPRAQRRSHKRQSTSSRRRQERMISTSSSSTYQTSSPSRPLPKISSARRLSFIRSITAGRRLDSLSP